MIRDARECEAIRLLRIIVEGNDAELGAAIEQARRLLSALRAPRTGRRLSVVTPTLLREIARQRSEGRTEHEIAQAVGIDRRLLHYHLRPSQAMQDAMMEQERS